MVFGKAVKFHINFTVTQLRRFFLIPMLDPFKPPSTQPTPIQWRANPTCIHIEICFAGFLLSLLLGLLLVDANAIFRIVVGFGALFICYISGYFVYWILPTQQPTQKLRIWSGSILVWLLLPFSAAMNAFATALGVYDPIQHDSYPYSITYWWLGLSVIMLPASLAMLLYHYDIQTRPEVPSIKRYCVLSLLGQIPVWFIWNFAPNLIS